MTNISNPQQDGRSPKAIPADPTTALTNNTSHAARRSVKRKADEFSDALHEKFMTLLNEKLEETGGHLTADDVTKMGEDFRTNLDDIETVFMEAVESFSRAQLKSRDGNERGNIFVRLMVHKFEHQFVQDRELDRSEEALSRRMLPGFQNALKTMVGDQKQNEFEKNAKIIVKQVHDGSDGEVDWSKVFNSSNARMITLGAQIEMAQHFREAEKRVDWLVAMVNSNLIPVDEGKPGADWSLTRPAALKMLSAVFSGLRGNLKNLNTREKIIRKLGPDIIDLLDDVAERFQ
jgi:hypothetical protein